MSASFASTREFVTGIARSADYVCIISKGKALLQQGIAHTSVIGIYQGRWVDVVDTAWDSSAIAVSRLPDEKLITVGQDGDVAAYLGGGKAAAEKIVPQPVMIRKARCISGYVFACGMNRQCYERVDEGTWVDVSAPMASIDETTGFEAIDGYSTEEIYAVGWNGEIWEFDGQDWNNRSSPTNIILTAVCCSPSGVVYVAGQNGIMIRGRHNQWELVDWYTEFTADIWDLCWFRDTLYLATMTGIYTVSGNRLSRVDFAGVPITTCNHLTSAGGILWSIGRDDIGSFDGATWRKYD